MFLGVKASSFDICEMLSLSKNIEFHSFYQDFETIDGLEEIITKSSNKIESLAVHAPITMNNSQFLDLGNRTSLNFASLVAASVSRLSKENLLPVPLVFNSPALNSEDPKKSLKDLIQFVNSRSEERVLITIENMPEFCWENNSQKKLIKTKLFHSTRDFDFFLKNVENPKLVGVTLDVCHFFMGSNSYQQFDDFVASFSDKIRHIHISDLKIEDPYATEGLQLGDGDLNFESIFSSLANIKQEVMLVPEIKDGHKDKGKCFKKSLEILKEFI